MGAARKPVLPVMVVCAVLVGWLVWSAVPALAAAPEAPVLESAVVQGSTVVSLKGELSPGGGTGSLTYQFDYDTNGTCSVVKASPEEPPFQQSTPSPSVEVVEGKQVQVSAEAQGLEPNEAYTFCLVATNASNEASFSNEITLQTGRQAPSIGEVQVTSITSTEATVGAEVYPHAEGATYRVEYGLSNAYGSSTTEASISAQHGPAGIQAQLTGLIPDSEYHYRIMATNSTGSEKSSDATFTTGETGAVGSQGLPDNRAFEMVTPPNNEDANVYVPEASDASKSEGVQTAHLFQVAPGGSAVAYEGDATSGGGIGEGGGGLGNQFLAKHLANGGWVTNSINPAGVANTKYQAFLSDLSVGVIQSKSAVYELPLSSEALADGYQVLYARATNENTYKPLFTNTIEPNRSREEFGDTHVYQQTERENLVFAGGSVGSNDLLFEANDALLGGDSVLGAELKDDVKSEIAKSENGNYLYDSDDGRLSLVDVSPEGRVVPGATFGGPPLSESRRNPPAFSGVISGDSRRVYWSSVESIYNEYDSVVGQRPTGLYLRVNPAAPQSPVVNGRCSVSGDACTVLVSDGEAQYWASAANDQYAFYTEGEGLYRFDAEPEAGHVSREVMAGSSAGVLGLLGVSNDGETAYFVAKGVLAGVNSEGIKPVEGEPNLYLWRDGAAPIFIGTLSGGDGNEVQPFSGIASHEPGQGYFYGDWQAGLGTRTSQVTASGGSVVFMSDQSLSVPGYPHGYPTEGRDEVYVYEAGSNSLFCASCGSTREGGSGFLPISWDDSYMPQWISEDGGRVFFDSNSSLVPEATDGKQNVYEWEREGSGTCTTGSGVNGGCVFLLSGGASESASWLIGASETGNDVFLATRAQLVPEDQNEAFDLYDVRVDGVKSVTPPQCTGSGCQGVPSPPPTFATPPSVTFDGVGNFEASAPPVVKAKAKPLSRAQKLTDALRQCRKRPKRKRASCEAQARKHYGPIKKARNGSGTVVKGRK
jgi:hypothetical protein